MRIDRNDHNHGYQLTMIVVPQSADMFRPPVNRAMKTLDRSFFKKIIPTSVARVKDPKDISTCRNVLHHDILKLDRTQAVKSVRDPQGRETKALLLKPEIRSEGKSVV